MHIFVFIFCIVLINLIVICIGTSGHLPFLYAAAPTKPTAGKPALTKPTAGKPALTKPTAGKPAPTKPTAGKPGNGVQTKGLVVTSGPEKVGSQTTILAGNKPQSALVVGKGLYMSSKDGKSQFYQDTGSRTVPISPSQAVSLLQSQAGGTSDSRRNPLLGLTLAAVAAYAMGAATSSAEKKQTDANLAGGQLAPTSGTKPLPSQTTVITDAKGKSYVYDPKKGSMTSCSQATELRSDDGIYYRVLGSGGGNCPTTGPRARIQDLTQAAQNALRRILPGVAVPPQQQPQGANTSSDSIVIHAPLTRGRPNPIVQQGNFERIFNSATRDNTPYAQYAASIQQAGGTPVTQTQYDAARTAIQNARQSQQVYQQQHDTLTTGRKNMAAALDVANTALNNFRVGLGNAAPTPEQQAQLSILQQQAATAQQQYNSYTSQLQTLEASRPPSVDQVANQLVDDTFIASQLSQQSNNPAPPPPNDPNAPPAYMRIGF